MTQAQLEDQVARRTGESIVRIHFLGFSLMTQERDDLEPEDVTLVLDCPFCNRPVPYPGPTDDGSETLAECDRCDVYFDFEPDEVYTVAATRRAG
jgi:hypothetical protein